MTYRNIHTSIWKDTWFQDLSSDAKLVFIYLFSNEQTTLSGLYKISLKVVAFETGIDEARVASILDDFQLHGKIVWDGVDRVVWVKNLRRYNDSGSPKVAIRISKDLEHIPDIEIKRQYIQYYSGGIPYQYPMDRGTTNQIKSESNQIKSNHGVVFKAYQDNIGMLTPIIAEEIGSLIDDFTQEWVEEAMAIAVKSNSRSLGYIKGILNNWKKNGKGARKTSENNPVAYSDLEALIKNFELNVKNGDLPWLTEMKVEIEQQGGKVNSKSVVIYENRIAQATA